MGEYLQLLPKDLLFQLNGYRLNIIVARPYIKLCIHPRWDPTRIQLTFCSPREYCNCTAYYHAGAGHVVTVYSSVTLWEDEHNEFLPTDTWYYHERRR
jgi:hypothetical protein